jgi:group II intron reverse transcriptase/maturase
MVRRDGERDSLESNGPCCASPAGESPVPVSVGAPGGRSPEPRETSDAEARRREPSDGRQGRGPQHEMKLAASKDLQRDSRVDHLATEATSPTNRSEMIFEDLSGVERAARVHGEARNTGDPAARPWQRESMRPGARATAVQRKSEGIIVPTKMAPHNAVGGKDPRGGHDDGNREKGMEALRLRCSGGKGNHAFDADIRDFFGSLDHEILMRRVMRRVSDRRVLRLIRMWLEASVMEDGAEEKLVSGAPQGGVVSPLLSNIFLSFLDERWTKQCAHAGTLVRYADDLVIVCNTRAEFEEAERRVKMIFARLKLELHPEKTRKIELHGGKQGFDFLGCHLHKRMSGRIWEQERKRVYHLQRWPSTKSLKRVKQRVKELTPNAATHRDLRETITKLNPVLRGWGNHFRTGNASAKFNQVDSYVWMRLRKLVRKRKGRNLGAGEM